MKQKVKEQKQEQKKQKHHCVGVFGNDGTLGIIATSRISM
jgi:hypothetical protein